MTAEQEEHIATQRFRQFLRIDTSHPKPDYAACAAFLETYARELNLTFQTIECVKGKPAHVLTWVGSDPSIPAIMLNCHTDVVPVSRDKWTHDPFAADKNENGDIFARGAQDMKCVGIQYMEAIRRMKASGQKPHRTLHVFFTPEEEVAGIDGMKLLVHCDEFKKLNIGFALDEGLACPESHYKLFYGERAPWWLTLTARGKAGHGSQFLEPTATVRLVRTLNKFMAFRESEARRLKLGKKPDGSSFHLGDVTTTNVTILKGGVQHNVVPEEASAGVDIRIAPDVNLELFKKQLEDWCREDEIEIEYVSTFWDNTITATDDSNKWWTALKSVTDKRNIKLDLEIFPAATDSRFIREIGIPAFGISPMRNTPVLLHDHDEFLNEKVFLEGVDFYTDLIPALADVREK
ncbi:adenylate cyclase [Geranomyces michiganensis]|nr:adenylate cyclase [Geranomyces michiganensis]